MKLYDEKTKVDFSNGKLFDLHGSRNLQRYDKFKYKFFYDQGQVMDSNFWKPAEVSLTKDNLDFKGFAEHEERIQTLNIKRQEILDSLQGRGPMLTFGRICTLPEFEYWLTRLTYQESNHSDTYAYILKNVYNDATEVFDSIQDDEMITRHSGKIAEAYELLNVLIVKWEAKEFMNLTQDETDALEHDLKKAIYLGMINWNILEGVRFYTSFACTFAFAENKKTEGNAKEIKLIARDENAHLAGTQFVINKMRKEESEGFVDIAIECEAEAIQMYLDAAEQEDEWADYLFEQGSIIGLNAVILKQYMHFLTNQRMKAIGLPKQFDITNNPLPWIDPWLGKGRTEVRAQETQLTDYKIASTSVEFEELDWI